MTGPLRANSRWVAALYGDLADCLDGASRQFTSMLNENRFGETDLQQLKELELRSDEVSRRVLGCYGTRPVNPQRMESAHALAAQVDDVVDALFSASNRIAVYELGRIDAESRRFGALISDSCVYVAHAVRGLGGGHARSDILPLLNEVYKRESEGNRCMDVACHRIFEEEGDVRTIIKRMDIAERLNRILDRCKGAAHAVDAITLNRCRRKSFWERWNPWGA